MSCFYSEAVSKPRIICPTCTYHWYSRWFCESIGAMRLLEHSQLLLGHKLILFVYSTAWRPLPWNVDGLAVLFLSLLCAPKPALCEQIRHFSEQNRHLSAQTGTEKRIKTSTELPKPRLTEGPGELCFEHHEVVRVTHRYHTTGSRVLA